MRKCGPDVALILNVLVKCARHADEDWVPFCQANVCGRCAHPAIGRMLPELGSYENTRATSQNQQVTMREELWGGRPRPRRTPGPASLGENGRRGRRPRSRGTAPPRKLASFRHFHLPWVTGRRSWMFPFCQANVRAMCLSSHRAYAPGIGFVFYNPNRAGDVPCQVIPGNWLRFYRLSAITNQLKERN